ncbi:MAG: PTS sugar transporter subunit IIC [Erysipelotrichaceae bacterium]|nr:PTS sugar transporter subunit IIC [Erysipelotrichaceae bacterium]
MNGIMNWLENSFAPAMKELFARPWIAAVSATMQKIIPYILTGSVIYFYNVIQSFVPVLPDLSAIANYSFGLITLIVAFMMGNQCMEKLNHPEYITICGITSVCVLFMVANVTPDALMGNLGPSGIACGMIVGLFTSLVFHLWGNLNFLKDSSIPDFVTSWINAIIPNLIVLGITMVLTQVLNFDLYAAFVALFMPVSAIAQTLPGFILICFVPAFFYTLGVSSWAFGAITTPLFLMGIQANIDAVAAGGVATNIVTSESTFTLAFVTMGGMCATLGLNVLMCFSKSKQLKTLGNIMIAPSIFNINEPVMFGAPVVFNPLLMLPAWINSVIGPVYVWVIMRLGLLNIPSKLIQVGQIPAPICSVMVTEDMRALLWWAVLFVIYLVVWYPFFKAYEKQKLEEENAAQK